MHPPARQRILYSIDCQPEGREGTQSLGVAKVGWELQGDSTQSTVLYQCQASKFSRNCLSSRKTKVGISPSKGTGHTSSFGGLDSCLSHHFLFVFQLLCAIPGYKLADTSAKSVHPSSSQSKHRSCLKFPRGTRVSCWDGCCHRGWQQSRVGQAWLFVSLPRLWMWADRAGRLCMNYTQQTGTSTSSVIALALVVWSEHWHSVSGQ